MKETIITVTEAARNFADCINRTHYQGTSFLLLKNGPARWDWLVRLFPGQVRGRVDRAGQAGWGALTAYVRGTVIVAATVVDMLAVTERTASARIILRRLIRSCSRRAARRGRGGPRRGL